jgi:hypothetical protein
MGDRSSLNRMTESSAAAIPKLSGFCKNRGACVNEMAQRQKTGADCIELRHKQLTFEASHRRWS